MRILTLRLIEILSVITVRLIENPDSDNCEID